MSSSSRPALVSSIEHLVRLAERRAALLSRHDPEAASSPAVERGRELLEHTRSYLLPRARDLDAPLVVLLLGPTGSGKSTLMNTLAGRAVSRTGVLRPTTMDAVVLATAGDQRSLRAAGPLASAPTERLEWVEGGARHGVTLIDAPDIDSVERGNRELADALLEIADLCVFVTTATRYADRVPWDVLARVEQRRLPLVVLVNRLPQGTDAVHVLDDVRRLLGRTGLTRPEDAPDGTTSRPTRLGDAPTPAALEVIGVPEGALDATGAALDGRAVAPLMRRLEALAADSGARRVLAEQALAGAVAGLAPLVHMVADDLGHQAIDADALRRIAATDHAEELRLMRDRLRRGNVLREEVIRQWHSFVGADQITRAFSSGIGRVRGAVTAVFRGTPEAPVVAVQKGASEDLSALVVAHASDAARRTATHWSTDPWGARILAADAGLWSASSDLAQATREALNAWLAAIASDVAVTGADKRGVARGVSLGVNAGAVTVMLTVFAHTGGLTGAEVGIAAGTAFLNQKLLNALFGEAAVQEMIARARDRLDETLEGLMVRERARFDRLVPSGEDLRVLAHELRGAIEPVSRPDDR
ncbi:MAG: 50S ribosome-binding GTPase [Chloroflexota bacterium]|nr:50S ribosome-binding GTPase [Chloroflexota bacterium]